MQRLALAHEPETFSEITEATMLESSRLLKQMVPSQLGNSGIQLDLELKEHLVPVDYRGRLIKNKVRIASSPTPFGLRGHHLRDIKTPKSGLLDVSFCYEDFVSRVSQRQCELLESIRVGNYRNARIKEDLISFMKKRESELRAAEEKREKQRLALLKSNNIEEYKRLLKDSTNERINILLKETDDFLNEMGVCINRQKGRLNSSSDRSQFIDLVHSIKERVKVPEILQEIELKPYQVSGLEWLVSLHNNKINGILADEMGLGKTAQTIALLAYLNNKQSPHLIIAPLTVLPGWVSSFSRWLPGFDVVVYKGSKIERDALLAKMGKAHVVLTTYDWMVRDRHIFLKREWYYVVVDEGHRLKNENSKLFGIVNELKVSHKLLLTGTPLQNNLKELWALLHFLLPKVFESSSDFDKWFGDPLEKGVQNEIILNEEEQLLLIHRFHQVLAPFILRRLKTDVLSELPDKQQYIVKVELSGWQKIAYDRIAKKAMTVLSADGKVVESRIISNTLMQLRKICNHPYHFVDDYDINKDLYRTSGKFEVLDRMLPKLITTGHKILIFSQMTSTLAILEDFLHWRGFKYFVIDGSTNFEDRKEQMANFNENCETHIFLLSTRAGGQGLNLQAADTVILFDSDFNPQMDLQAMDRAHRVGQKNQVRVFRLVTLTATEHLILEKAEKKVNLDSKVIQAGLFDRKATEEDRKGKLISILEQEAKGMLTSEPTTWNELNKMLSRNDNELKLFDEMDVSREQSLRLMSANEVPHWVLGCENEIINSEPIELTRDMRKGRPNMVGRSKKV